MARLKFLLFAVPVLALWILQLFLLSPALTSRAIELAAGQARALPAAVGERVDARRAELTKAALRITALPGLRGHAEAPTAAQLTPVRTAALQGLSEALRHTAIVGWVNDAGALVAKGDEDPKPTFDGLDLAAAQKAGVDGAAIDIGPMTYWFHSISLSSTDKTAGAIIVGAPLIGDKLLGAMAQETNAAALALLKGGKKSAAAGPDAAAIDAALKDTAAGKTTPIAGDGPVADLFGVGLPMFAPGNDQGGPTPRYVASRKALEGTSYEVIALVSLSPYLESLASFQKVALFAFAALLAMTLLGTILAGSAPSPMQRMMMEEPPSMAMGKPPAMVAAQARSMGGPAYGSGANAGLGLSEAPPPPEASPDDFQFGPPPTANHAPAPTSASGPMAMAPPPAMAPPAGPPPGVSQAMRAPMATDPSAFALPPPMHTPANAQQIPTFDQATRAYPIQTGQMPDPFAPPPAEPMRSQVVEFNPDQTRIQEIPDELIRASAQGAALPKQAPQARTWVEPPPPPAIPLPGLRPGPTAGAGNEEEAHFQDIYREFVSTREKCGEPADGLTYEKFAVKLRKNKEQLVQKYNCKTVRFQVYVKEGKAALKATPVRE